MHISDNNQTDNRTVASRARATRISNPPSPFDSRGSSEPWKCDDGCMSSLLFPPLTSLGVYATDNRYRICSPCRHDDRMPPHDELHHCDPESTADRHSHGSCAMEILSRLLFLSHPAGTGICLGLRCISTTRGILAPVFGSSSRPWLFGSCQKRE